MIRIVKLAAVVIGGLILVSMLYAGLTLARAHGGLPQWDGALAVSGLDGRVEIVRDEHGIPYIGAETERDLYFAQGFVHAQDRFWQMALTRRSSQGRLSEWFGSVTLSADRRARWFDWSAHAERSWEATPDREKAHLQAYAAVDAADAALADTPRAWDHRFDLDTAAPTIFMTWVERLSRRLLTDELDGLFPRDRLYLALVRALGGERPEWCDDRRTDPVEGCPEWSAIWTRLASPRRPSIRPIRASTTCPT